MTATPFASACELAAMIRSGQISAYQLTELYLAERFGGRPAAEAGPAALVRLRDSLRA